MEPITPSPITLIESPAVSESLPPIAIVEALDSHGRVQARHRLIGVDASCTIGRDLHCELVIDDAFVAARHTQLVLQADGRVVVIDLGSANPTRLPTAKGSKTLNAHVPTALSDEILLLGNTRIRIRTQLEAPSKEQPLKYSALLQHRITLAIVGIVAVCLLNVYQHWLGAPSKLFNDVLSSTMAFAIGIATWVALWALVSRVVYGKWNIRTHLAIACVGLAASMLVEQLLEPAAYVLQWNWLSWLGGAASIGCVLAVLYLHLRVATELTVRTAVLVTLILPGLIGGASKWLELERNERNVTIVDIDTSVYPPVLLRTQGKSLDDYLNRVSDLKAQAQHKRLRSLKDSPLNGSEDIEESFEE
jgi:pSer/pThr/pTyr-binding forkhead associated (FHA) protein